jgi:hypothetical protein
MGAAAVGTMEVVAGRRLVGIWVGKLESNDLAVSRKA